MAVELSRYRIVDVPVGEGAVRQGSAVNVSTNDEVLYTQWDLDHPASIEAFENEISAGCALKKKRKLLCTPLVAVEEDGCGTLLYPHLTSNLYQYVRRNAPHGLEPEPLRLVFQRICKCIYAMHASGVAHLDLNPESFLFQESVTKPLLAHFSCAHTHKGASRGVISPNRTILQTVTMLGRRGAPRYAAPETFESPDCYDPYRADMYSLGVSLHFLATGRCPRVLEDHYGQAPILDVEYYRDYFPCSASFELVWHLLARNPQERPSITEVMRYDWVQIPSRSRSLREKLRRTFLSVSGRNSPFARTL